jgi:hypothetical protein
MIGNSVCLRVKRGKPGKHSANWLYEREDETELSGPRKTNDRELLVELQHPSKIVKWIGYFGKPP